MVRFPFPTGLRQVIYMIRVVGALIAKGGRRGMHTSSRTRARLASSGTISMRRGDWAKLSKTWLRCVVVMACIAAVR